MQLIENRKENYFVYTNYIIQLQVQVGFFVVSFIVPVRCLGFGGWLT